MKTTPRAAVAAIALALSLAQTAIARDTYDPATRQLTIPEVAIGSTVYSQVVIRLDNFAVVSVGPVVTPPIGNGTECTSANFTRAKYDAIALNMTQNEVNQLIGCIDDPRQTVRVSGYVSRAWIALDGPSAKAITVYFNETTNRVAALGGAGPHKMAAGF